MRPVDVVTAGALEGSRPADSLLVWAWRGGQLVLDEPLDVVDWSFSTHRIAPFPSRRT